jgi:NAD(P)-dependent dehydrogenase (short-subunit alcohol dehydrogenase family)
MDQGNSGHVLITGSSTGIGRACALHLARKGYSVLAGVRRETDAASLLAAAAGDPLQPILIDVADADSIAAACVRIAEITGNFGLRGLVNNAGIGVLGPVEFVEIDGWRKQFEVNLFGQIAVTQAMLPLLRRHVAARGAGAARIINIGSIAGRIGQPILGPYCASKHAMEALSDVLRLELAGQGVQVSLLEPGAIKSEIWRKGEETASGVPADAPARQNYGQLIDAIARIAKKSAANAPPAELVATVVERCLTSRRAPSRVVIGRDAKVAAILRRFLPDHWFDAIFLRAIGIGK